MERYGKKSSLSKKGLAFYKVAFDEGDAPRNYPGPKPGMTMVIGIGGHGGEVIYGCDSAKAFERKESYAKTLRPGKLNSVYFVSTRELEEASATPSPRYAFYDIDPK